MVDYDDTQSIGRRYRRQDEIGTPLAVTVDFDSLDDGAVTIRDRDTIDQVRVPIAAVVDEIRATASASESPPAQVRWRQAARRRARMAARLASTSAAVVAHDDTLMRMAGRPCQSVPPQPARAVGLHRPRSRRVVSSSPNDTSTWLSVDLVQHLVAGGAQPVGEPGGVPAAPLDQVGQP